MENRCLYCNRIIIAAKNFCNGYCASLWDQANEVTDFNQSIPIWKPYGIKIVPIRKA